MLKTLLMISVISVAISGCAANATICATYTDENNIDYSARVDLTSKR